MYVYMQRMMKGENATLESFLQLKENWGFEISEIVHAQMYKIWFVRRKISSVATGLHRLLLCQDACPADVSEMAPAYVVFPGAETPYVTVISFDETVLGSMCEFLRKLWPARVYDDLHLDRIPSDMEVQRIWKIMNSEGHIVTIDELHDGPITMAEAATATSSHQVWGVELYCGRTLDPIPFTLYTVKIFDPPYGVSTIIASVDNTEFEEYFHRAQKEVEIVDEFSRLADLIYSGDPEAIRKACVS